MASSSDLEKRANEAFVDDNFELAVDLYTQALHMDPRKPDLFADRAQANIKLNNYTEAVADSNRAIELDPSIPRAYLRKGTACIKLEEYQTAKAALEVGASLAPTDARFPNLIKECNERMEEEANDQPKVTHIAPTSTKSSSTSVEGSKMLHDQPLLDEVPLCKPKPKYRHEFFQKPEEVVVTVFAKGVSAKILAVEFGEQILSITIDIPGEEAYHFQPRLFGKIIPEKCRYSLLSTKIEIRLAKAEAIHWTYLEFCKDTVPQKINVSSGISAQKNTYPTSKPKAVDWDKLEAQVKKEEKEEKLDGDAALNKLFRDIYRDADEDTRRAMRKSFVESNGTVLSTNWKEVGKKRVQGSPPDGMEMKKWEY